MKLIAKILAALAVTVAGGIAIAGIFWFNFRNFNIRAFGPASQAVESGEQADSVPAADDTDAAKEPAASVPENTDQNVISQEKAVTGGVPAKKVPTEDIISAPSVKDVVQVVEGAVSDNHALTRPGVIDETNRQRQINLGLGVALKENSLLDQAAQAKVDDMFAGQYFEHVSPSGNDASYFVGRTGYEYIAIGENLAMGNYESDTALVKAWMDSPGHRENILKKGFTEIGVAVGYGNFGGRMVWLAVQEFGTPESACPAVDESLSARIDGEKEKLDNYSARQDSMSATIDMKKDVIESLQDELAKMADSGDSYTVIKAKQQDLSDAIAAVNTLVDSYNGSIGTARVLYEKYKEDIEDYNNQVNDYNDCIGAI